MALTVKNLSAKETLVQSLGPEDDLEKGMTIHSNILACRIPWTEESARLQPTGSQRVGATEAIQYTSSLNGYLFHFSLAYLSG